MKRRLLLLLLVCILLVLAACDWQTAPTEASDYSIFDIKEASFAKTQVKLSEAENNIGSAFGLNKDLETLERNGVTYGFEPKIAATDREACIRATEAVLRRVAADRALRIYIYTAATYGETFVEDGMVFTSLQEWESPEYISALLQGLFGEYCNYGAVYGYANYLTNAVFDRNVTLCDENWKFQGDVNVLDMNLLCFHYGYFSAKDVKTVKRLANTFAAEYIKSHGEAAYQTLLARSGNPEEVAVFVNALSDFYADWGIDYVPSPILYRLGGKSYDYIVKSQYAVMYMEKDWREANTGLCPELYEGFLHQNYADVRDYFATNIEEMGKYQALLGLESYHNDLDVYFTNHYGRSAVSYIPASHSIAIRATNSLSTVYLASLIQHTDHRQEGWATTGFLQFFCAKYNDYGVALWNYMTNVTNRDNEYSIAYRDYLGRDADFATDMGVMSHIDACKKHKTDPNSDYTAGGSFVAYLVSRLGEEQVIKIVLGEQDFGEYSYEALVSDWQAFLKENFSDGSVTE